MPGTPKIILIGLPKSGTTSFQCLFEKLNYRTYHQYINGIPIANIIRNNKVAKRPLLSGITDDNYCLTQLDLCVSPTNNYWPQITDFEQLYRENPNCIFILNKRNTKSMLKSWKNQKYNSFCLDLNKRLYKFNPELVDSKNDKGFAKFVENHYSAVETFFGAHPDAKFLTFDIENDTINKLKKYIDIGHFTEMPHENKSKKERRSTYAPAKARGLFKIYTR